MSDDTSKPPALRLLYIEDHEIVAKLFLALLDEDTKKRAWEVEVKWVGTLTEGLASAQTLKPDLILLDLGLKDSTKDTTISAITELCTYGPVHVLTASSEDNIHRAVEALGAGFSHKLDPFQTTLERAIATMVDWLPRSKADKERWERLERIHEALGRIYPDTHH